MTEGVKRRYDSSRRQEQAQENRRRIVAAAQALFVDKGYGRTTIADIAGAAGVAAETVYAAFRNKPTLLHRAWDVAVGGDEQDVHLLDRPEMRAVLAEPDLVTRLARFADVNTAIMRRTAPLLRALRGAAASEPAAAALVAEADGARLEAMGVHAAARRRHRAARGLRGGVPRRAVVHDGRDALAPPGRRARVDRRPLRHLARSDVGVDAGRGRRGPS